MFGVSVPEILIILSVILLVLGPERLPGAAQKVGKFLAALRQQTDAVRKDFYNSVYPPAEEFKQSLEETTRELRAVASELGGEDLLTCEEKALLEKEELEEAEKENQSNGENLTELNQETDKTDNL